MTPIMTDKSNTRINSNNNAAASASTNKNATTTATAAAAAAAPSAPTLDLQTCTPQALAEWLLANRFVDDNDNNSEMNVTQFLLQAISRLPNAQAISDQFMMNDDDVDNDGGGEATAAAAAEPEKEATTTSSLDLQLGRDLLIQQSSPMEVSLTVPRTKAAVTWYEAGIRFVDKKQQSFTLHTGTVERMILFPKPEDCQPKKKVPSDLVLLILKKAQDHTSVVSFKNKTVKQVCLQLPADLPAWNTKKKEQDDDDDDDSLLGDWSNLDHTDQWTQVFCQSLGLDARTQTARVYNPSSTASFAGRYQFSSHQEEHTSTTTDGMPFVKCYYGVNDGVLYPMVEGLLFFKPPLFLPRSALHSIACGRGGGGGGDSSRYVDLTVEMMDEENDEDENENDAVATKTLEFTNIHRSELTVMREYIHKTLIPAMQRDVAGDEGFSGNHEERQEESNSDDIQDEAVEEEEEESSSSNRRGGKRKASAEAREVTKRMQIDSDEDEDDDDDYGGEEPDDEDMIEAEDEEESEEDEIEEDEDVDEESATESEGDE